MAQASRTRRQPGGTAPGSPNAAMSRIGALKEGPVLPARSQLRDDLQEPVSLGPVGGVIVLPVKQVVTDPGHVRAGGPKP